MRGEPVPWTPVRVCRESACHSGVRHLHAWLGENDPFPSLTIRADWPKPTTKRTPGRIANDPGPLPAAPRPYPTGTPWRNRHRCTSSTSRCNGSCLPSPDRAGDVPLPAPAVIVPRQAAPGTLPNGGLLPVSPPISLRRTRRIALAEHLPSMLSSRKPSRRAVGFPIPHSNSIAWGHGRSPWQQTPSTTACTT